jgi:hypothetical protein
MKKRQPPHQQRRPATPLPQPVQEVTEEQLKQVMGGAKKVTPGPSQMQPDPIAVE